MREDDVPQDNTANLGGQRKRLYARTASGEYVTVLSNGWEAEDVVLNQAIAEYQSAAIQAYQRVQRGESATLEYHMYQRRMDVTVLAQSTGFFKWQVRRHLRPAIFRKLSSKTLQRYQDALQLSQVELTSLPDEKVKHD